MALINFLGYYLDFKLYLTETRSLTVLMTINAWSDVSLAWVGKLPEPRSSYPDTALSQELRPAIACSFAKCQCQAALTSHSLKIKTIFFSENAATSVITTDFVQPWKQCCIFTSQRLTELYICKKFACDLRILHWRKCSKKQASEKCVSTWQKLATRWRWHWKVQIFSFPTFLTQFPPKLHNWVSTQTHNNGFHPPVVVPAWLAPGSSCLMTVTTPTAAAFWRNLDKCRDLVLHN